MRTIDYFMILCACYPFLYIRHTLSVISDLFICKVNTRYSGIFPGNFLVFALEFFRLPEYYLAKIHFEPFIVVCETVKLNLCTAHSKCELIQG